MRPGWVSVCNTAASASGENAPQGPNAEPLMQLVLTGSRGGWRGAQRGHGHHSARGIREAGRATPGRHAGRPSGREGPEPEEALGHSLLPPASLLLASHWLSLSESQPIGEEGPADAAWRGSPARARGGERRAGGEGKEQKRGEPWAACGLKAVDRVASPTVSCE